MTACQKIVTSLLFFQFAANLEQSGSRIPDAQSVNFILSLIVTFYLTKNENRIKISLTQLSLYCFESRYYFGQKMLIFCKKADISKIKKTLVIKGIFSEITYERLLACQILHFQRNSNEFLTGGGGGIILPPSFHTSKQTPKKPTQIWVNIVVCESTILKYSDC